MGVACEFCSKTFSRDRNMRRHAEKFHFAYKRPEPKVPKPQYTAHSSRIMHCPICSIGGTKTDLIDHYLEDHSIECLCDTLTFESYQEFEVWKTKMEKETTTQFIKPKKPYVMLKDGSTCVTYCCSRTGYSFSRCTVRHQKLNGSSKLQGYCPASMKVTVKPNGTAILKYTKTHVGHALDLNSIFLTSSEREEIARKLALNIPHNVILDGIRDTVVDNNLERLHLLRKQDLYNIARSFHLPHPSPGNDGEPPQTASDVENADSAIFDDPVKKEVEAMVQYTSKDSGDCLNASKEKVMNMCSAIQDAVASASSIEVVNSVGKILKPVIPTMNALEQEGMNIKFHATGSGETINEKLNSNENSNLKRSDPHKIKKSYS